MYQYLLLLHVCYLLTFGLRERLGRDRMAVAISAYHH